MTITELPIGEIKINPHNPRTISDENFAKLCDSIKSFPRMIWLRPLVIDNDNVVIGGNMRLRALKALNYEKVPVVRAQDLTAEEKRKFVIVDNLAYGEWDADILGADYDVPELESWGMNMSQFGVDDLSITDPKDDEVPSIPATPKSTRGQIYKLGNHRIMCGDSTSVDDVDLLMDGERADMVFTDPPYNVKYVGKTKDALTIQNDEMSEDDFNNFVDSFVTNLLSYCKGAMYICMSSSEWGTVQNAFKKLGGIGRE